jgi:hypothetical protein
MRPTQGSILLSLLALACAGCTGNVLGVDESQILSKPEARYTNSLKPWYLYTDDLQTGPWLKGLDFWSGGGFSGTPSIRLDATDAPDAGLRSIKFSIPGPQSSGGAGWWGCGMILLQGAGFGASNASPGVDLSAAGFTQVRFRARVSAGSSPVMFEAANATSNITPSLTTAWQDLSISLSSGASQSALAAVKQFFAINLGSGAGTVTPIDVYVDDLRYE